MTQQSAVAHTLSLCLKTSAFPDIRTEEWAEVFEVASAQRCAALAWVRNSERIQTHAPPAVTARWRHRAFVIAARGERLFHTLVDVQQQLLALGVTAIAVKGPALALRLYGAPVVRPIDDIDLFVPSASRSVTRNFLFREGWRRVEGGDNDGWEVFEQRDEETVMQVDVFSHIPKHFRTPASANPFSEIQTYEGVAVRAYAGPAVPSHLAVHLAKHDFPPLLWYIDFATLWFNLTVAEQRQASDHARTQGLQRYLAWAVARASDLDRAMNGDAEALKQLGFVPEGRWQPRRWRREVGLAGSVRAKAEALFHWLVPPTARSPMAFVKLFGRRLLNLRSYYRDTRSPTAAAAEGGPGSAPAPGGSAARTLELEGEAFIDLLRAALDRGVAVWVRASGRSMEPTVPYGALVRLQPLSAGILRPGTVVLVLGADGRPLIHRVRQISADWVQTIGDSRISGDVRVARSAIMAAADAMQIDGVVRDIPSGRSLLLYLQFRRIIRRITGFLVRAVRRAR